MSVNVPPPRRAADRPIERRTVHRMFLVAELAASSQPSHRYLARSREMARLERELVECASSARERRLLYELVCDGQELTAFPAHTAIHLTILRGIAMSNPPVVHRLDEVLRMVTRCKPVIKDFHRGKCVCGCVERHRPDQIRDFMRLSGALRRFVEDDAGVFWIFGPDEFVDRFRDRLRINSRPCRHCGALLASYGSISERVAPGRPRLYCTDACRQAEYRKRVRGNGGVRA
ncbi:hypothetical protein Skr01_70690 [Sphaerisporangium krabiense]|uniref:Uncharacterized protein n=1 Tax=Sphaerisporangium krabiense TaxID=763782 RepID=A0A7W8Z016_9ACTN|nr:hypothetical protein [Sphaerisporangium krabiense]MBB5624976.1 hypothetical protein [Sphaerisporangium krabiense]GII66984.1 hypothetical protein Skr01_70690 [Sphaerisporangium krabiense]